MLIVTRERCWAHAVDRPPLHMVRDHEVVDGPPGVIIAPVLCFRYSLSKLWSHSGGPVGGCCGVCMGRLAAPHYAARRDARRPLGARTAPRLRGSWHATQRCERMARIPESMAPRRAPLSKTAAVALGLN